MSSLRDFKRTHWIRAISADSTDSLNPPGPDASAPRRGIIGEPNGLIRDTLFVQKIFRDRTANVIADEPKFAAEFGFSVSNWAAITPQLIDCSSV
jgi:hypothetical protein